MPGLANAGGYDTGAFNMESQMKAASEFIREDANFQNDQEMESRSEMSAQVAQQSVAMSFSRQDFSVSNQNPAGSRFAQPQFQQSAAFDNNFAATSAQMSMMS